MDNLLPTLISATFGGLAFAAYVFGLGGWAYRDAEKRGKPGWLVALLVLFGAFPLGWILWILFRPDLPPPHRGGRFDLDKFRVQ